MTSHFIETYIFLNVDTYALVEFCEEDKPLGVVPICNIKKPAKVLHIGDKCSVLWSNKKSYDGLLIYSGNLNSNSNIDLAYVYNYHTFIGNKKACEEQLDILDDSTDDNDDEIEQDKENQACKKRRVSVEATSTKNQVIKKRKANIKVSNPEYSYIRRVSDKFILWDF